MKRTHKWSLTLCLALAASVPAWAHDFQEAMLSAPRVCQIVDSKWITHDSPENQMAPGGYVASIGFDAPTEDHRVVLLPLLYGDRIVFRDGQENQFVDWLYIAGTRYESGDLTDGDLKSYLYRYYQDIREYPYSLYFTPLDAEGKVIRVHYILGDGSQTNPASKSYVTFDCAL